MIPAHAIGGRAVRVGGPLPGFTLPNTSGDSTRLWNFKQRRPVLLAVLSDGERADARRWLRSLAERRADLDELDAAVLLVLPEPIERLRALQAALGLSFTLLSDESGAVSRLYSAGGEQEICAVMVAADRYLQCLGVWRAPSLDDLPSLEEPLTLLLAAEQEDCGCGLPAWPVE